MIMFLVCFLNLHYLSTIYYGSVICYIFKKTTCCIIRNVDSATAPSFEITYFYGDVSKKMGHFALNVRNINTPLLLRREAF